MRSEDRLHRKQRKIYKISIMSSGGEVIGGMTIDEQGR